jgi:thioredoxin 1
MKLSRTLVAIAAFAISTFANALDVKPYTETAFAQAQKAGQASALHFHADWCPTCKKQSASIEQLKADKALAVTIFVANYDTEKALKQKLGVNTQSTLIVFKGATEKARLAGQTSPEAIKEALVTGL